MEAKELDVQIVETTAALEAINRAEVDIQISTAKRFPRDVTRSINRIKDLATRDPEVAEGCFYSIPRDGKAISGPSIRFAEIVASSWCNLLAAARVTGEDEKFVTCQGIAHDLETNVSISVEVKRKITGRNGRRYSDDMVNTTANAGCAIALRNAIFKVVPSAVIEEVKKEVAAVGAGDARTLKDKQNACVEYFKAKGYSKEQVLALVGKERQEDIDSDTLMVLQGVVTAIKEETTTLEDVFRDVDTGGKSEKAKAIRERLKKGKKNGEEDDKEGGDK